MLRVFNKQNGLKSRTVLIAVACIIGAIVIGLVVRQTLAQHNERTLYKNAEAKINKLGDDILVEHSTSKYQKEANCHYLSAKFDQGARVCDVSFKILLVNTTEAQAVKIFESAVTKAQEVYSVRPRASDGLSALRIAKLEEKMPIFCSMSIDSWSSTIPSFVNSEGNWSAPANASLLTIHCGGSANAEHFKVVER
ncbi:MAG: hypothetical protein WAS36_03125 [Candidatus Saccharimonadales bacterium]